MALALFGMQLWLSCLQLKEATRLVALFLLLPAWCLLVLVDTITPPFNLSEAESELVGGFTTEHMSVTFIFVLLSEYAIKVFMGLLTACLFFGQRSLVAAGFFALFHLCQRTYLSYKPDWLMAILWWKVLPVVILVLVLESTIA